MGKTSLQPRLRKFPKGWCQGRCLPSSRPHGRASQPAWARPPRSRSRLQGLPGPDRAPPPPALWLESRRRGGGTRPRVSGNACESGRTVLLPGRWVIPSSPPKSSPNLSTPRRKESVGLLGMLPGPGPGPARRGPGPRAACSPLTSALAFQETAPNRAHGAESSAKPTSSFGFADTASRATTCPFGTGRRTSSATSQGPGTSGPPSRHD